MSRRVATRAEIAAFLRELGRRFKGSGSLFLDGGSMLVYQGYRIELTSGDDGEFIQALRATQRLITLNVEAASPADFIPLPQGWRERSTFLTREGGLTIYAFDPLSTALAKIERSQQRDSDDVLALCQTKALSVDEIIAGFENIAMPSRYLHNVKTAFARRGIGSRACPRR